MKQIERIGISLDKNLLSRFDKLLARQGYQNRSEAVRDLLRKQLSDDCITNPKTNAVAVVSLVYDHHSTKLMEKLTSLQHSHLFETISSLHVHLSADDCMEVIVLKGPVSRINPVAEKIISQKGVKLGKVNLMATEST